MPKNNPGFSKVRSHSMHGDQRTITREYRSRTVTNDKLNIISVVEEVTSTTVELDNGEESLQQVLTASVEKNRIMVSVEWSVFVGSVAAGNQLPGGSGVDESDWQVIGPYNSVYKEGTLTETEEYENASQLYVRNISAGTTDVIFRSRVKYIVDGGGIV